MVYSSISSSSSFNIDPGRKWSPERTRRCTWRNNTWRTCRYVTWRTWRCVRNVRRVTLRHCVMWRYVSASCVTLKILKTVVWRGRDGEFTLLQRAFSWRHHVVRKVVPLLLHAVLENTTWVSCVAKIIAIFGIKQRKKGCKRSLWWALENLFGPSPSNLRCTLNFLAIFWL